MSSGDMWKPWVSTDKLILTILDRMYYFDCIAFLADLQASAVSTCRHVGFVKGFQTRIGFSAITTHGRLAGLVFQRTIWSIVNRIRLDSFRCWKSKCGWNVESRVCWKVETSFAYSVNFYHKIRLNDCLKFWQIKEKTIFLCPWRWEVTLTESK